MAPNTRILLDIEIIRTLNIEHINDIPALQGEEQDCPLCKDKFSVYDMPVRLPCGHLVGLECLRKWLATLIDRDTPLLNHLDHPFKCNFCFHSYAGENTFQAGEAPVANDAAVGPDDVPVGLGQAAAFDNAAAVFNVPEVVAIAAGMGGPGLFQQQPFPFFVPVALAAPAFDIGQNDPLRVQEAAAAVAAMDGPRFPQVVDVGPDPAAINGLLRWEWHVFNHPAIPQPGWADDLGQILERNARGHAQQRRQAQAPAHGLARRQAGRPSALSVHTAVVEALYRWSWFRNHVYDRDTTKPSRFLQELEAKLQTGGWTMLLWQLAAAIMVDYVLYHLGFHWQGCTLVLMTLDALLMDRLKQAFDMRARIERQEALRAEVEMQEGNE